MTLSKTGTRLAITGAIVGVCLLIYGIIPLNRGPISLEFTYQTKLKNLPVSAKKLQIWFPLPRENDAQVIWDLEFTAPGTTRITQDNEYGNPMLYIEKNLTGTRNSDVSVVVRFKAKRKHRKFGVNQKKTHPMDATKQVRFLQADQMVPLNQRLTDLQKRIANGKDTAIEKSKAFYDYILDHMSYNKTTPGWGQGDAIRACIVGTGNCTDYHSLFNGLARTADIPSKFVIGFPIQKGQKAGKISGYHCWAEFYDHDMGWIPVDISEADKNPEQRRYLFGNLPADRIEFSEGRDILLNPAQNGARLNFFIYPYIEVDGHPFRQVENEIAFRVL